MNVEQQAGKNFAWLSLAQIAVRILGAAFFFFMAYKLHDEGIGQYSFIASFVPFWFLLIDFGGGDYLYREWARGLAKETIEHDFLTLFTARLTLTSLILLPFLVFNFFFNREILPSLVLFYFSMFLAIFVHLGELYLQSINAFGYVAKRQVLEKSVSIVSGIILLTIYPKIPAIFIALILGQIVSIVYYYVSGVLPFRLRIVFDFKRSKELFAKGLPFLLIGIFTALYARIDMTMLRFYTNFDTVGWYGTAYKFIDVTYLFPSLFLTATFPLLSHLYGQTDKLQEFKHFLQRNLRILFSGALLVAGFFIFFSPLIISQFFDESFGPSILALRILMIGQAVSYLSVLFSSLLLIQRKERMGLLIVGSCAILNIVLNVILIPKFSLYGAAWATTICEILNLLLLQHFCVWDKDWKTLSKMFILFFVNVAALVLIRDAGLLNNLTTGIVLMLTNAILLFTVKLVTWQDLRLFIDPFVKKLGIKNL